MSNNLAIIFSFVLFTIIPAYAASPEQPNSVPAPPNSETIIDVKSTPDTDQNETPLPQNPQTLINDANKGYPSAQFKLGEMYSKGNGAPQDNNEAVKWFTKAAEKGHTEAQFKLGEMYSKGNGVPKDDNKASKWFTKAAERGNATAQRNLALMYYDGKGVIEDYVEAYKWALLAGMNGEDVTKIKQDLTTKMTPEQIAEAQKLAKDFAAKKQNANNNSTTQPNLPTDANKDASRVERLSKNIQEMKNTIELNKKRIGTLPSVFCTEHNWPRADELDKALQTATKKYQLLADQEKNYKNIINLAERYHDLGVNVMDMKKKLIEYQGQKEEVESVEQCLRDRIQHINNKRVSETKGGGGRR
jgi:TPR repeat protein